jgi:integrase
MGNDVGGGKGSLYQRKDGRWVGAIVVGYDPETQNPRHKHVYGLTKDEARKKLVDLQQKQLAGLADASSTPLQKHLDFWLDSAIKPIVDAATLHLYRQRVNDYIVPHLGTVVLDKLTKFQVAQLYQDLEKEGHSPDLRKKVGRLLRQALKYAVDFGLLLENVAMKIKLPKAEVQEMHPLDEELVIRFLVEAESNRHYPLYLLAIDSGMRQGEMFALEWTDIDFVTGIVSITKTAQLHMGRIRIKEVKTKASRRRIRLTPRSLTVLAARKAASTSKLVFPNRKGGYLQRANVARHSFKKILVRAGLPEIRFHDLRHTFATLALLKTKNIKAVSARLGHRDIRVTLNTYSHWLPVMEAEIVDAMEEILTKPARQEPSKEPSPEAENHAPAA